MRSEADSPNLKDQLGEQEMVEPIAKAKKFFYDGREGAQPPKGVYFMVGPITGHKSDAEFQLDLELMVINYNRRHGFFKEVK